MCRRVFLSDSAVFGPSLTPFATEPHLTDLGPSLAPLAATIDSAARLVSRGAGPGFSGRNLSFQVLSTEEPSHWLSCWRFLRCNREAHFFLLPKDSTGREVIFQFARAALGAIWRFKALP
mgnify:FL=1